MSPQLQSLTITGRKYGFNKVGTNQLLRTELGYELADAKTIVERVLDGDVVVLAVPEDRVPYLRQELERMGAVVAIALR